MKYYFQVVLISLMSLSFMKAYSQTNLRELGIRTETRHGLKDDITISQNKLSGGEIIRRPKSEKSIQDTVYCFQTTKRHGWFEPLGILTKEQAQHRSNSIMFTGKNEEGHWTKMECVNAYGKYTPGGFAICI